MKPSTLVRNLTPNSTALGSGTVIIAGVTAISHKLTPDTTGGVEVGDANGVLVQVGVGEAEGVAVGVDVGAEVAVGEGVAVGDDGVYVGVELGCEFVTGTTLTRPLSWTK